MLNLLDTNELNILRDISNNKQPQFMKDALHNVLNIDQFENLINLTPFTNDIRFNTSWSIPQYNWTVPDWSTGINHWPSSLIEHFLDSGTCYLRDCSRINEKINNICAVLEKHNNVPVDAHVYFTKNKDSKNNFGVHKDEAHNLIIQVQGSTHWQVGSNVYKEAKKNLDNFYEDDIILINEILNPGDIIFVPAYVYHSAKSLTKRISISFPIPDDNTIANFEERNWINWHA